MPERDDVLEAIKELIEAIQKNEDAENAAYTLSSRITWLIEEKIEAALKEHRFMDHD